MRPSTARRLTHLLLIAIAAAIFFVGIDWGLPSRDIDSYLYAANSPILQDSTTAYQVTGAGIAQLAGKWDDNPQRGADVATHAIADRSQPLVLLYNNPGLTGEQIAGRGDKAITSLLNRRKDALARWRQLAKARGNQESLARASERYYQLDAQVQQAIERYNEEHLPDYLAHKQQDAINRARILMRYRLYSHQPDEMITFRALAQMHPRAGDFDPRLYQYGGLWIYPIGGLIQAAGLTGFVTVTPDLGFYLDHPEEFGRFYVIARAYSAVWGIVAALAIYALVRRAAGSALLAFFASIGFALMPAVVNQAHEAKPHLAGLALMLLALLAAGRYARRGSGGSAILVGALCGAAASMVLSAWVCLLLVPAMVLLRRSSTGARIFHFSLGVLAALIVYAAADPYVVIHLLHSDHGALASNLQNSAAIYANPGGVAWLDWARLIAIGASWPLAFFGSISVIYLAAVACRARGSAPENLSPTHVRRGIAWVIVPLAVVLVVFVAHSGGRAAEYARFALPVDVALLLACFVSIGRLAQRKRAFIWLACPLLAFELIYCIPYEIGFVQDAGLQNTRIRAADQLETLPKTQGNPPVLAVPYEPAPWSVPPVDLFRWQIVLLPRGARFGSMRSAVEVSPEDALQAIWPNAGMSWANKPFSIGWKSGQTFIGEAVHGFRFPIVTR